MSDETPIAAHSEELQFNEAEYSAPVTSGVTCQACQQAIPDHYFQVNGAVLCEPCSSSVKSALSGGVTIGRFFKATAFGLAASFAGFLIYFGILKLTGYEIGLISILVGYMVGGAVKCGSGGRGGRIYQVIAVCCTYLAIAMSYSALVIPMMIDQMKKDDAAKAPNAEKAAVAPADNAAGEKPAGEKPADEKPKEGENQEAAPPAEVAPMSIVVAILLLLAFMLALPILAGFSQPIGLLIIGFALWEAGKLTKKVELVMTGPHNVGRTPDPAPANA